MSVPPSAIVGRPSPPCPVCQTPCLAAPIFVYSVEQAASHFCPPWRNAERHAHFRQCIRTLWGRDQIEILSCPNCTFTFGHPHVGGDEQFYLLLHQEMGYPAWRWDYDAAWSDPAIKRLRGGRALDIGAGSGVFLQSLGSNWERHAVESTETTRTMLRDKGITVHADLRTAGESTAGTFSLITLFQVLEHIADFASVLTACRHLLRPDGVLFITVPDAAAMREQEEMTGWPDMPPNHINRWTPQSLAVAMRQVGLQPGAATFEPAGFHNVAKHLYHKVLADSMRPWTLAAQAYRIRRKRLRAPVLRVLGGLALLKMAPHLARLPRGGAFALAATPFREGVRP